MRSIGSLLVALSLVGGFGLAGQGSVRSGTVGGITAEVGFAGGGQAQSDQMIIFCFLTTNALGSKVYYPVDEYLCRARLWDEQGRPVQPRGVGKKLGRHFSDLRAFSPDRVRWINRGGSDTPRPFVDYLRPDGCAAQNLYTPQELFEFASPGRYRLELEFQVFLQGRVGTNVSYTLIRLPAVQIPVIKPKHQVSPSAQAEERR